MGHKQIFTIRRKCRPSQSIATVFQTNILHFLKRSQVDDRHTTSDIVHIGPLGRQSIGYEQIFTIRTDYYFAGFTQDFYFPGHFTILHIHLTDRTGKTIAYKNFILFLTPGRSFCTSSHRHGIYYFSFLQIYGNDFAPGIETTNISLSFLSDHSRRCLL